jgi:glycosyltransferase involved in cell wall biosynthesis
MAKVSVIIPARNEPYLIPTLRDVYQNAAGDIEVIVILDGPKQPEYKFPKYKSLRILQNDKVRGLRYCINKGVEAASGKYILKLDAHCTIGEAWDEILQADCADNWMVAPRRYLWDAPNWNYLKNPDGSITYVDAHYYFWPFIRPYNPRPTSRPWPERAEARKAVMVDEDMNIQGSGWFMERALFHRIGGMNEYGYGTFSSEPEELGFKIQLGEVKGAVMRNKKTWFAHWQKPPPTWWNLPAEVVGRCSDDERINGNLYCFDFWFYNRWTERVRDFDWLIDRFWPVPTWPLNWRGMEKRFTRYPMPKLTTIYQPEPEPEPATPPATMDIMESLPFRQLERSERLRRAQHGSN